jgi:hypothetical protein
MNFFERSDAQQLLAHLGAKGVSLQSIYDQVLCDIDAGLYMVKVKTGNDVSSDTIGW